MRRPKRNRRLKPVDAWIEQLETRIVPTTLNFRGTYLTDPLTPAATDINGDGWTELLGATNNQSGKLTAQSLSSMGLAALTANGRVNRHTVVADFNGDGRLDVVANTY